MDFCTPWDRGLMGRFAQFSLRLSFYAEVLRFRARRYSRWNSAVLARSDLDPERFAQSSGTHSSLLPFIHFTQRGSEFRS